MNCHETTALLSDRLNGLLTTEDERRLDEHLTTCAACREEAEAVTEMWNDMDIEAIDVPSARMRARFHAALAVYDERARWASIDRIVQYVWPRRPALQLGAAFSLLVAGILIGRMLPGTIDAEISGLRQDMRIVSIALLQHQSATERLRGVDWLQREPDSSAVTDALLNVVRNDRSVNVRLAAVEALGGQLDRPSVGAALTDLLNREQTPLMQVTLAEMLLRADVSGSAETVQQLIDRSEVDVSVQEYLQTVLDATQEDRAGGQLL